ncbi:hypothetical protein [Actinocrispum sp. NPDC049592]|uniref:hypothetical protein n=1 Tax=Actinocrispum sp. NPDC049592 TaxID=3154835 RepID=UPI00343F7D21
MADWKTDAELYDVAQELGNKIADMYTDAGVWVSAGTNVNAVVESVRLDAEDFMSLDPQKIIDEFERMQRAASQTGEDAVAKALLDEAGIRLQANWNGEAALAFGHQMSYIETFMQQQDNQIGFAAHCMGTLYALAVNARRSYHDIANATIAACEKEMKEQTDRENKALVSILGEVAKACIAGFTRFESAGEVVKWGLDGFISAGSATYQAVMEGSEAKEVVQRYLQTRNNLRGSFEDGLNQLTKWITLQESELAKVRVPLLEPLPLCMDIKGADFSYDRFFSTERDPASFGPKVEQEREKLKNEQIGRPAGLIGRRLAGGES